MAPNRRLKQARELRGWSQAKVAELIGTDATTVSRWERGLFLPTPFFREKLCELFGKNAEELGLLDTTQSFHTQDMAESPRDLGAGHTFAEGGLTGTAGVTGRAEMITLKPRPTPEGVDTFTYILQRSSQEQQAYMLWEHAYVQALQEQRTEAQRLGQASVKVFEQARHPNAALVRAWLHQEGLTSGASHGLAPDPSLSSTIHQKRSSRPWLRVGGAGVFVVLVIVGGLLLSNFTTNRSTTYIHSNVNYAPQALLATNTPVPGSSSHHTSSNVPAQPGHTTSPNNQPSPTVIPTTQPATSLATPVPTSAPTVVPTATPGIDLSIMPTITPSQLSPTVCTVDGSGYRCTITFTVYANAKESISWQASSSGIPVKFNSLQGTVSTSQNYQEIVYIYATCSQQGKISFVFRTPSSSLSNSLSINWGC